ncbi:UNKNOWN [Stylonychia lemnae]|uniref:Uncharacterized protein n=1 Tax=Stylonychia lemnae TaxID=5949 RepID=A0A078AHT6_STYLE|nr:UNKNOWN [Stylonychia lemnae]|eukprot:CDW81814.1 UNKNOWN [Stylonychia lemnae]
MRRNNNKQAIKLNKAKIALQLEDSSEQISKWRVENSSHYHNLRSTSQVHGSKTSSKNIIKVHKQFEELQFQQQLNPANNDSLFEELIIKHSYQSPSHMATNPLINVRDKSMESRIRLQYHVQNATETETASFEQNPLTNPKMNKVSPKSKISATILRMPIVQQDLRNSPNRNQTINSIASKGNHQYLSSQEAVNSAHGGMNNNNSTLSYRDGQLSTHRGDITHKQQQQLLKIVEDYKQNNSYNNATKIINFGSFLGQKNAQGLGNNQSNNYNNNNSHFKSKDYEEKSTYQPIHSKRMKINNQVNSQNTQSFSKAMSSHRKSIQQEYENLYLHSKMSSQEQLQENNGNNSNWVNSNMLKTRGRKMPFSHWNESAQKQNSKRARTSPPQKQKYDPSQKRGSESPKKDITTSPRNEQIIVKQMSTNNMTNLTDETVMRPVSFDNNKDKSNQDLTPKKSSMELNQQEHLKDSPSSTAKFKTEFKTLDSNNMDDELKQITKIYGKFHPHPLPIKVTGGKRLSSQLSQKRGSDAIYQQIIMSQTQYKKFKNNKFLFKDDIYLNQDSEQLKKQNLELFYKSRDQTNREKYIEFLKKKLMLTHNQTEPNTIEQTTNPTTSQSTYLEQTSKIQDISFLQGDSSYFFETGKLFDRFQDLNRFKKLLQFDPDSQVKKSEITQSRKNEFLLKIRQKIKQNENQPLMLQDDSKLTPLASTHHRNMTQLVNLRSLATKHNDPNDYLDYLASKRLVLPALGDDQVNGSTTFYGSVLSHGDFGKDVESFDKPVETQINFHQYEERARNGSSFQKVMRDSVKFNKNQTQRLYSQSSGFYNDRDDKSLKLKVSANVDFVKDKLDMSLLKKQKMRSRREERVRLLGKQFYQQQEKQKQHDLVQDQKRKELENFLSKIN